MDPPGAGGGGGAPSGLGTALGGASFGTGGGEGVGGGGPVFMGRLGGAGSSGGSALPGGGFRKPVLEGALPGGGFNGGKGEACLFPFACSDSEVSCTIMVAIPPSIATPAGCLPGMLLGFSILKEFPEV